MTTLNPADYGLATPTALNVAALLADAPGPDARRGIIVGALTARREELALMRQLLIERDGRAPDLARIEATDDVLVELTVLAVA